MTDHHPDKKYRLAIRRPVTIAMFFLTVMVFGWKSYQGLPVSLMPDISYPSLTVRTEYQGAAPEDVEKLVTRRLEEVLSIVSGLVEISSASSPGLSEITMEFTWGTDMNMAVQEVRDRLDMFQPPKEVTERPSLLRFDPTLDPVLRVAITGSDFADGAEAQKRAELTAIREACERHVKGDLEAENGIAQVSVKGGREQEIQVLVDTERLKGLGLSLENIVTSLAQQNINLSGGRLREGKTEYLVRTLNEFQDVTSIRDTLIVTPRSHAGSFDATALSLQNSGVPTRTAAPTVPAQDQNTGQPLRLRDIATVNIGERERETVVHVNGKEAVALDVFKDGDANTVQVCSRVKDILGFEPPPTLTQKIKGKLSAILGRASSEGPGMLASSEPTRRLAEKIRSHLPPGARFTLIGDQSRFIKDAVGEAHDAAIKGGFWALLIVFLFLHRVGSTVIIGLAIPISLIATFIPMRMTGMTLNVMSLGGLALAVGHLVDDSIIVLESIARCSEEGDKGKDAVERGVREILGADISTTVTNCVVFLPIGFVAGVAGQIFGNFAFTMTFSLLSSLAVALYLDVMLSSLSLGRFDSTYDLVWAMRAFRTARNHKGMSRIQALRQILPLTAQYIADWFRQTTRDTFGPTISAFQLAGRQSNIGSLATCVGRIALFPLTLLLYLLLIILKVLSTSFLTACFLVALLFVALGGSLWLVVRALLWVPLKTFEFVYETTKLFYSHSLGFALRFGPLVLVIAAALFVHALFLSKQLGRELIPPMKQGEFSIRMEAPAGTRLEETERRAQKIEQILLATPEIGSVGTEIGQEKSKTRGERGENVAQFNVVLKNPSRMVERQEEIISRLRGQIATVSADQITFTLPTLFSFKTAVEVQIRGDNIEELRRVGQRTLDAIKDIPGLKDPELSVKRGYPEVIIQLDRDLLASKGLSPIQVAQRLRTEVQGDIATRFNQAGNKIDIRVRTDQDVLKSLQDLKRVSVVDSTPPIPLDSVAKISLQDGPSEIRRIDQRQVVMVHANVEGFDLGRVSAEIEKRLETVKKPADYSFEMGGQNRELRTSYRSLQFALLLSMFLVYVVMAIQFESLIQPALIMFTVPLGFVGVIYVLYLSSIPLSIAVFMGGILLVGVVVNNSVLLVDYANQLRARGRTKRQAIYESGLVRFRPVLMTAITTIVGSIPMAMGGVEGSELRRPLAVTIIAGLSVATVLTLVVIPVVYNLFAERDKKNLPTPVRHTSASSE